MQGSDHIINVAVMQPLPFALPVQVDRGTEKRRQFREAIVSNVPFVGRNVPFVLVLVRTISVDGTFVSAADGIFPIFLKTYLLYLIFYLD